MPFLAEDFLTLADQLLPSAKRNGAARRRAVSTCYYALFHRLAALCATQLMGKPEATAPHWRAYRALEHRQCRDALTRSDEFRAQIGTPFAKLQDVRQWADYSSAPHFNEEKLELREAFTLSEARECVSLARQTLEAIDALDKPARRRLATLLLVRDRR